MSFQASFILNIINFCEKQGADSRELIAKSGINTAKLSEPIPLENVDLLWQNAIELTGDPFLGLHIGEDSNLSALGVVGQLIQNSSTIREALEQACQFIGLLTETFEMKMLEGEEETTMIHIIPGNCRFDFPQSMRQVIDCTLVFTLKEYQALRLEREFPNHLYLDYPAPSDLSEFKRIFNCPISFNSTQIALQLSNDVLDRAIPIADNILFHLLQTHAIEMLKDLESESSTASLVKEAIIKQSNCEFPQICDVAALYNKSERTLQRELQQEGTSFKKILDEVKKDFAIKYLERKDINLDEVSYMLGYNNLSAFTRTFKRWTGTTPSNYRVFGP